MNSPIPAVRLILAMRADDPDFQPFREMVHVPVFEHLARMLASLLLYIGEPIIGMVVVAASSFVAVPPSVL